jgi:hypothetical protein
LNILIGFPSPASKSPNSLPLFCLTSRYGIARKNRTLGRDKNSLMKGKVHNQQFKE